MAKDSVISAPAPATLIDRAQEHDQSVSVASVVCSFSGKRLEFRPCCENLRRALQGLFGHLDSVGPADLTVFCVGSECFPRFPARAGWDWAGVGQNPADGVAWHTPGWDYLTACDSNRQRCVILARGLSAQDFGRREVMRLLLHKILDFHGVIGLHGASIGDDSAGVLLSNKGGSGKSTLVLSALQQGMQTAGDDFLLTTGEPSSSGEFVVSSYFPNIKIYADDANRAGVSVQSLAGDDKGVMAITAEFPLGLVTSHSIKAVVVPTIGARTILRPASYAECLQAILPSSVHLTSRPEQLLRIVNEILERTPRFSLTVGPHVEEGVEELAALVGS